MFKHFVPVLIWAGWFGNISAPAAEPTTRPSVIVDLTSPRAAVRTLAKAAEAMDDRAILAAFYAANDADRELANVYASLIVSTKKLGEAVQNQFGGTANRLGAGIFNPAELAHLDQAELKEDGDNAILKPMGQSRALRFHRTGERWQLVIRDFANADQNLAKQVSLLKQVGGVFDDMAKKIEAGQYEKSKDAEAAIQTKLAVVMIRAATPATTRATSKPTTAP